MDGLGENLKKVLLAGVGAVAVTAEKSKDLLDEMVKKGEITVEQGKVLKPSSPEELQELVGKMTPEQLADLKAAIQKMEEEPKAQEESGTDPEGKAEEPEETSEEDKGETE